MRTQVFGMLAALAFAVPSMAQTEGKEAKKGKTEALWKVECSGIGG